MKAKHSVFSAWFLIGGIPVLLVLLLTQILSTQVNAQEEINYCYKPSKPLFLSTQQSNKRYAEDIIEYERCQQYFIEMKQRVERLKNESHEHSQHITNNYRKTH